MRGDNKRGQGGTAFPMICCCGITGGEFGYSGHAVAALVVHIHDIKGARQKISVPTTIMLPVSTVPFQNARRIMNATIAPPPPPLFWKRMLLIVASVIAILC